MARLVILGRLAAAAASTSRAAAWVPTTTGLGCRTGAWCGRFALQGAWWSSGVSGGVEGYSNEMLASLDELKIKELDAELKRVGLLLSGRKADKVERLSRFIRSQEGATAVMTHKEDAELAGVQVVRSRKAESRRRSKSESRRASGSRHKRDGGVEGKGKTDTSLADLVWADQALHINRRTDVAVEMEKRRRNERKGGGIPRDVDAGLTHTDESHTFVPQIEIGILQGPDGSVEIVFCDLPGQNDNRGPVINIANATNNKVTLQAAASLPAASQAASLRAAR